MAVYRFRVTLEDNEDVYREIEIKSTQHFEDFHNIIIQSIGFDNLHNASFYISDDYWRKGDEITLHPLSHEEIEKRKRNDLPVLRQMNKSKMASLIDDPHQKFVYIYDPKNSWTFLVELVKILLDDPKGELPKCVKTVGESPKQHKSDTVLPPIDDDDFDEEDDHHKDAEAYGHSEDETSLLEGEEGEEDETESDEEEHDEDSSEFEAGEEHGDGEDF